MVSVQLPRQKPNFSRITFANPTTMRGNHLSTLLEPHKRIQRIQPRARNAQMRTRTKILKAPMLPNVTRSCSLETSRETFPTKSYATKPQHPAAFCPRLKLLRGIMRILVMLRSVVIRVSRTPILLHNQRYLWVPTGHLCQQSNINPSVTCTTSHQLKKRLDQTLLRHRASPLEKFGPGSRIISTQFWTVYALSDLISSR